MRRLKAIGLSVLVAGQVTGAGCGNADHAQGLTPIETVAQRLSAAPVPAAEVDAVTHPGEARIQVEVRDPTGAGVPYVAVSAGAGAQAKTDGQGRAVLAIPRSPGQPLDRGVIWLEHPGYEVATRVVTLDPLGGGQLTATLVPKTVGLDGRIVLSAPGPDIDLAQVRICTCQNPIATFSSVVRADGRFELRGLPASNDSFERTVAFTFKHPALQTKMISVSTRREGTGLLVNPVQLDRL